MTETIYLDEHSQPIGSDREIRRLLMRLRIYLPLLQRNSESLGFAERSIRTQSILKNKLTVLYIL